MIVHSINHEMNAMPNRGNTVIIGDLNLRVECTNQILCSFVEDEFIEYILEDFS